jgi:hypothetical protein
MGVKRLTYPQMVAAERAKLTLPQKQGVKRRDLEGPVQAAIVQFLDLALDPAETFWSATLNGVKVTPRIMSRLRAQGLRKGVLDIVLIPLRNHPRIGVAHWCEVKADEGRLTTEQKALMAVLQPLGLGALVRSADDVQAYLLSQQFNLKARL